MLDLGLCLVAHTYVVGFDDGEISLFPPLVNLQVGKEF